MNDIRVSLGSRCSPVLLALAATLFSASKCSAQVPTIVRTIYKITPSKGPPISYGKEFEISISGDTFAILKKSKGLQIRVFAEPRASLENYKYRTIRSGCVKYESVVFGAAINGLLALTYAANQVTADQRWLVWDGESHRWKSRSFTLVAEEGDSSDLTVWIKQGKVEDYFDSGVEVEVLPIPGIPSPEGATPTGGGTGGPPPGESFKCMDIRPTLIATLLTASLTTCGPDSH